MPKSISFRGKVGGDGECFLWHGMTEDDRVAIIGAESHAIDKALNAEYVEEFGHCPCSDMTAIYPGNVCDALDVEAGKYYRFTISVEEIS